MSMALSAFLTQRGQAASLGVSIVRNLLTRREFPEGFSPQAFTTAQLFNLAVKEPAPSDFKPYPLSPPKFKPNPSNKKKKPWDPEPFDPMSVYPPHPDHPVRSMRFLKREILPVLEQQRLIKLLRVPRAPPEDLVVPAAPTKRQRKAVRVATEDWIWKVAEPGDFPNASKRKPEEPVVIGTEVGVGLDTSHLNKRRARAREDKTHRSVLKMKAHNRHTAAAAKAQEQETRAAPKAKDKRPTDMRPLKSMADLTSRMKSLD